MYTILNGYWYYMDRKFNFEEKKWSWEISISIFFLFFLRGPLFFLFMFGSWVPLSFTEFLLDFRRTNSFNWLVLFARNLGLFLVPYILGISGKGVKLGSVGSFLLGIFVLREGQTCSLDSGFPRVIISRCLSHMVLAETALSLEFCAGNHLMGKRRISSPNSPLLGVWRFVASFIHSQSWNLCS